MTALTRESRVAISSLSGPLTRLWSFVRPYRTKLALAVLVLVIAAAAAMTRTITASASFVRYGRTNDHKRVSGPLSELIAERDSRVAAVIDALDERVQINPRVYMVDKPYNGTQKTTPSSFHPWRTTLSMSA